APVHGAESRGVAGGLAELPPPRSLVAGNAQVRYREPGEARLRLRAAAGRAFIADFSARAGGRARERRDRGRMIVRFDLHENVDRLDDTALDTGGGVLAITYDRVP